jgi:hypothetical protein
LPDDAIHDARANHRLSLQPRDGGTYKAVANAWMQHGCDLRDSVKTFLRQPCGHATVNSSS